MFIYNCLVAVYFRINLELTFLIQYVHIFFFRVLCLLFFNIHVSVPFHFAKMQVRNETARSQADVTIYHRYLIQTNVVAKTS